MKKVMIFISLMAATLSFAKGPGQDRKPPQEAISACEGKSEGTTCSVTTPRGDTLSGTCKNTPDDKYFVCMPENMSNGRPPKN